MEGIATLSPPASLFHFSHLVPFLSYHNHLVALSCYSFSPRFFSTYPFLSFIFHPLYALLAFSVPLYKSCRGVDNTDNTAWSLTLRPPKLFHNLQVSQGKPILISLLVFLCDCQFRLLCARVVYGMDRQRTTCGRKHTHTQGYI